MSHSRFLTNNQGIPLCLFHGTRAEFDQFLPLSHFTPDQQAAAAYSHSYKTPWEYSADGTIEVTSHINNMLKNLELLTHPQHQGKVIPAYLRISHPLVRRESHPECYAGGSVYAYLRESNKTSHALQEYSNPQVDFIFVNPFEISDDQVTHELTLDTLYQPSYDSGLNRSHLVKQRFVQFWESCGYDSFKYILTLQHNHPAYVIFRPDQVHRLDRPNLNPKPIINSIENKIELNKISYSYMRSYKPRKLEFVQHFERVGAWDLWQRG